VKLLVPLTALGLLVSVLLIALVLRHMDSNPSHSPPRREVASQAVPDQPAQALPGPAFVRSVILGDLLVTEWSKLAFEKSGTPESKTFAQKMIDEGAARTAELKKVAQGVRGARIPTELPEGQKQELSKIDELSPALFDRRYKAVTIRMQERAVGFVQAYAQDGDNPDLKK
jgi:predicted outer membrane protein